MTTLIPKYDQGSVNAINRPFNQKLQEIVSVLDFGADNTGATDATAACQNAINAVRSAGGGTVFFPAGTYLLNGQVNTNAGADTTLNGLLIPFTSPNLETGRIFIRGAGRSTIIKAGSNNMYMIRMSDSNCAVEHLTIDGNSKTSVYGIGLVPENVTTNSTTVFQTFNTFYDLYLLGLTEGIIFRSGIPVSSQDSGCWYNNFNDIAIYYCTRGIWFAGTSGHSAGNNRNNFNNMRIGQNTNTGIQIDDGGTNIFSGVHMEGINVGTSPNTNPTGIFIAQTGASGADNNSNKFFGCIQEVCTVSLNNSNSYSEFYGCEFSFPYSMVLTANPQVLIGSIGLSPQFLPGYTYQSLGQISTNANNVMISPGVYSGLLEMVRQNTVTGPGGSTTSFNFNYGYDVTSVYLVNRGGWADSSTYAFRSSYFYETAEGTFVEASTRIFDQTSGSVTFITDTLRRSASNTGFVQVVVNVNKSSTVFTNWASVTRVA